MLMTALYLVGCGLALFLFLSYEHRLAALEAKRKQDEQRFW